MSSNVSSIEFCEFYMFATFKKPEVLDGGEAPKPKVLQTSFSISPPPGLPSQGVATLSDRTSHTVFALTEKSPREAATIVRVLSIYQTAQARCNYTASFAGPRVWQRKAASKK